MGKHTFKQGNLDGLCGVYSIINAINHVTKEYKDRDKAEKLFIKLIKKNSHQFPLAVYNGADFSMIREFVESIVSNRLPLNIIYPFVIDRPKKITKYLNSLQSILSEKRSAAIVAVGPGLHIEQGHWTVITKVTDTHVHFSDSNYEVDPIPRSDLSFSFTNRKLGIYPVEVIVLQEK